MGLKVSNLYFSYDSKRILEDVSFHVPEGSITGLIGKNGVGKTTTIRNIIQRLKPDSGLIEWKGKEIKDFKADEFPISYIPDEPVFYDELTVLEHLNLIKALYPDGHETVDDLIGAFELDAHLQKVPMQLSKGTLQKLMIAIALLRRYEILIADEPISGLDPEQIYILKQKIISLRDRGKTILLSTHLLDIAEDICDRYVILDKGKVIAEGTKEFIASENRISCEDSLEDLYLTLLERKRG